MACITVFFMFLPTTTAVCVPGRVPLLAAAALCSMYEHAPICCTWCYMISCEHICVCRNCCAPTAVLLYVGFIPFDNCVRPAISFSLGCFSTMNRVSEILCSAFFCFQRKQKPTHLLEISVVSANSLSFEGTSILSRSLGSHCSVCFPLCCFEFLSEGRSVGYFSEH